LEGILDTAGLRDTDERVERLGVEVARRYLAGADLILFCVERGRRLTEEEERFLDEVSGTRVLVVGTKMDLPPDPGPELGRHEEDLAVSVKTGEGLERFGEVLPKLVFQGLVDVGVSVPVVTRRRHADGIRMAKEELESFQRALREELPAEVAATHLRPAETALEELLGVIPRDEILDRLFSEFCIGK
jgi:tRNA modification GTPase